MSKHTKLLITILTLNHILITADVNRMLCSEYKIINKKEDVDLPNNDYKCGCGCEHESENFVLAMAYVKMQKFDKTFSPENALNKGTLFPELDKPFCGRTVMGGGIRHA